MSKDYNEMWKDFSKEDKWREYILPKRNEKEFYHEGELQAEAFKKYVTEFDSALEFGCGIGRVLTYIEADNKIGVDVCQSYLNKIVDESITKVKSDGLTIEGVDDESVDFIYSIMVFQHTKKIDHINYDDFFVNETAKGLRSACFGHAPKTSSSFSESTAHLLLYSAPKLPLK